MKLARGAIREVVGFGYTSTLRRVRSPSVIKSTGYQILDNAALAAFRNWRWKPGKWKQVDVPITFKLEQGQHQIPPGAVPLPRR